MPKNNFDSVFSDLLPEYGNLKDVIKVFNMGTVKNDVVNIYMNTDKEMAIAVIEKGKL